jgi:DNA-binding PadR family transcriptional regulator
VARFRVTDATLDVLEVLLGLEDDLYGLKIAKAISRPTGSVFPILARLEECGWVVSEWEAGDPAARGPRRRFYRLTPDGRVQARDLVAERRGRARLARSPLLLPLLPGAEGTR